MSFCLSVCSMHMYLLFGSLSVCFFIMYRYVYLHICLSVFLLTSLSVYMFACLNMFVCVCLVSCLSSVYLHYVLSLSDNSSVSLIVCLFVCLYRQTNMGIPGDWRDNTFAWICEFLSACMLYSAAYLYGCISHLRLYVYLHVCFSVCVSTSGFYPLVCLRQINWQTDISTEI